MSEIDGKVSEITGLLSAGAVLCRYRRSWGSLWRVETDRPWDEPVPVPSDVAMAIVRSGLVVSEGSESSAALFRMAPITSGMEDRP